ncbi:molybdenum cofactor guanylyltransferase [Nitratidesulfovibrio sp. HK-II]|uniref:molybdenum cofactor guanylyltransferase n=1 Tax=Nitratidesulfovibrio sp. HK-II TaxID=2009266 RepID=UPI000E2F17D5|nr:molybdenum cofactor guanylyltransferase [Nitratidesulfovibrio sp. HK-II]
MSRGRGTEHTADMPEEGADAAPGLAVATPPGAGGVPVSDGSDGSEDAAPAPDRGDADTVADVPAAHGVVGVVLAGGLSTRLGQDKTRLHLHGDAAPDMLARTAALLHSVTGEVWISCRGGRPCPVATTGVDGPYYRLNDEVEGMGPFGGVITALRVAQGPVLVLSCDLPFMERAVLDRLLARRAARRPGTVMTTFRQVETGFIESLVAVYEFEALPLFRQALEDGERKLSRVVPPDLREHIPYSVQDALPFFNINYPADLEMARRIIGSL